MKARDIIARVEDVMIEPIYAFDEWTLVWLEGDLPPDSDRICSGPDDPCAMPIFVKTLTGKTLNLHVAPTDLIVNLKREIGTSEGIAISHLNLVFAGRPLRNSKS